MNNFPTNKINLLRHLNDFSKNEILNYSSNRNYDLGEPHHNVSKLSPFLRRRFITEEEVLGTYLEAEVQPEQSCHHHHRYMYELMLR